MKNQDHVIVNDQGASKNDPLEKKWSLMGPMSL